MNLRARRFFFERLRNEQGLDISLQGRLLSGRDAALPASARDVVVTKHRISAFKGTDLEMILRAKEIDTLVLFGIATSGVVLSTLLDACDADYRVIVLKDCSADQDTEVHSCLVEKIFSRRGTVMSASEFLDALKGD